MKNVWTSLIGTFPKSAAPKSSNREVPVYVWYLLKTVRSLQNKLKYNLMIRWYSFTHNTVCTILIMIEWMHWFIFVSRIFAWFNTIIRISYNRLITYLVYVVVAAAHSATAPAINMMRIGELVCVYNIRYLNGATLLLVSRRYTNTIIVVD